MTTKAGATPPKVLGAEYAEARVSVGDVLRGEPVQQLAGEEEVAAAHPRPIGQTWGGLEGPSGPAWPTVPVRRFDTAARSMQGREYKTVGLRVTEVNITVTNIVFPQQELQQG